MDVLKALLSEILWSIGVAILRVGGVFQDWALRLGWLRAHTTLRDVTHRRVKNMLKAREWVLRK